MRTLAGSMIFWAFLCSSLFLLEFGAATTSSATGTTSSPATTPSPAITTAPTTLSPTISPTPSPESSSSSSTSRGTVVAWALLTVAVCVGLLILLYSREQSKRRRIHQGESLRQSLTSADGVQPQYHQQQPLAGKDQDPTMSSF